jgi:beta-phosphoglucomutase
MPERTPILALIFDMDGLLVDSETASADALKAFLNSHGQQYLPGTMEGALGRRLPEAVALIAATYRLPLPVDDLVAAFDRMRLQALHGNVVAMPGAAKLIDWARDAGLRLALATSSYRRHADVSLAEAGLQGHFDVEVTGDEVSRGKPDPDLFLLAATRLSIDAASCVVFEDAPAGLEAAARAGMRRVWIPNEFTRHLEVPVPIDATLNNLAEAIAWLRRQGVGETPSTS